MALSGLAQRCLDLSDGALSYFAGLWSGRDLVSSLLWSGPREIGHPVPFRPRAYRAPTWSWASVENQIHWPLDLRKSIRYQQVATITDIHTVLQSSNLTGQIKDASLIIKGPLLRGLFSAATPVSRVHLSEDTRDLVLDVPDAEHEGCICLGIAIDSGSGTPRGYGIALMENRSGSYRRIGYFCLLGTVEIEMFRTFDKEEATII